MILANKYALGAGCAVLALAGVWMYGHYQYKQGVADTQTAAKIAAAKQYEADVARINDSVGVLQARIEELQNDKQSVRTVYRERVIQAPLPSDCHIDDGRLLTIQDGLDKARSAGQSGSAMP